jgi:2'-hydroxyisoflavone reductase
MRVLVLGGTAFLGRYIVESLLARGHEVTIFHRGQRGRDLFPDVERVLGDRRTDLDRLPAGATWDAVVDTSTCLPGFVATSAGALRDRAGRYLYVSSVSVYDMTQPAIDESSRVPDLPPGASRDVMVPETYGMLKAECEREALAAFGPDRTFVVRPGLIVGPNDYTDRYTYWPVRFARGGDVAVPNDLDAAAQWIDVRDLAAFAVEALERELSGTVNTVGPAQPATLRELLTTSAAASGVPSRMVPIPLSTLKEHGVGEWIDLPMWATHGDDHDGILHVNPAPAIALGLRYRPLAETAADTLRWAQHERGDEPFKAGLTPERERDLLAATAPSSSSAAR